MPQVFREQLDYYIAPKDKFGLHTGFYVPDDLWAEYVIARSEYQKHWDESHLKSQRYLDKYWRAKREIKNNYER